ncbi:pentatricopeptide repeat-containing protein, partial [Tanacetum coccineum]
MAYVITMVAEFDEYTKDWPIYGKKKVSQFPEFEISVGETKVWKFTHIFNNTMILKQYESIKHAVWKFLITFADVLRVWPFTLDKFVEASIIIVLLEGLAPSRMDLHNKTNMDGEWFKVVGNLFKSSWLDIPMTERVRYQLTRAKILAKDRLCGKLKKLEESKKVHDYFLRSGFRVDVGLVHK